MPSPWSKFKGFRANELGRIALRAAPTADRIAADAVPTPNLHQPAEPWHEGRMIALILLGAAAVFQLGMTTAVGPAIEAPGIAAVGVSPFHARRLAVGVRVVTRRGNRRRG